MNTETATRRISQVETNRLIRTALKATFPSVRFSVRASNASMHTSTVISWPAAYRVSADLDCYGEPVREQVEGPTVEQVREVTDRFASQWWSHCDAGDPHTEYAAPQLVSMDSGELPEMVSYGAGHIECCPRWVEASE